jgi:hypothetical protein
MFNRSLPAFLVDCVLLVGGRERPEIGLPSAVIGVPLACLSSFNSLVSIPIQKFKHVKRNVWIEEVMSGFHFIYLTNFIFPLRHIVEELSNFLSLRKAY